MQLEFLDLAEGFDVGEVGDEGFRLRLGHHGLGRRRVHLFGIVGGALLGFPEGAGGLAPGFEGGAVPADGLAPVLRPWR